MSVTSGKAIVEQTYIAAWEINHPDYGHRHVLAFQNQITNLEQGANCLILPIQSIENLKPEWIVELSTVPDFMQQLYDFHKITPNSQSVENHSNLAFEDYYILIINKWNTEEIQKALLQVPVEKRPTISAELIDFYTKKYGTYKILLCCFNNTSAKKAAPILVHYRPVWFQFFMFNTLNSNGMLPDLEAMIPTKEKFICGSSYSFSIIITDQYKDSTDFKNQMPPALRPFLPDYAASFQLDHPTYPNKDICIERNGIGHRAFEIEFAFLSGDVGKLMDKYYPGWEDVDIYYGY